MNFDILLKLIKLANHNNSDGEANAAARKACSMLAEENYKWIESVIKVPSSKQAGSQQRRSNTAEGPADVWEDMFRDIFGRGRSYYSKNPYERAREQYDQQEAYRKRKEEDERKEREYREEQRKRQEEYERRERAYDKDKRWNPNTYQWEEVKEETRYQKAKYKDPFTGEYKTYNTYDETRRPRREPKPSHTWENSKGFKKVYTERIRRCVRCGFDKMTTDEVPAYVCSTCKRSA